MKIGDETEKPWGKVEKDSRVSCEILRYVESVKFVLYVYIVIIMINHMVIFLYINVKAVDKYHFFVSW